MEACWQLMRQSSHTYINYISIYWINIYRCTHIYTHMYSHTHILNTIREAAPMEKREGQPSKGHVRSGCTGNSRQLCSQIAALEPRFLSGWLSPWSSFLEAVTAGSGAPTHRWETFKSAQLSWSSSWQQVSKRSQEFHLEKFVLRE